MIGRRILRNISANYFGVIAQIIIAFLIAPFLINSLGDEVYGYWMVVMAFFGYMALLNFGIGSAVTKFSAEYFHADDSKALSETVSSAAALLLASAFAIALLAPLGAYTVVHLLSAPADSVELISAAMMIGGLEAAIFVFAGIFRGTLGGLERFDIINLTRVLSAIYRAFGIYLVVSLGHSLIAIAVISTSAAALMCIACGWSIKRFYPQIKYSRSHISKASMKRQLSFGKHVFVTMLTNQVGTQSSPFVIGAFLPSSQITLFAIPLSLIEHFRKLLQAIGLTYLPMFAELSDTGKEQARRYVFATRIMMIASNLFVVGLLVLGDNFIEIWIGEGYGSKTTELLWVFCLLLYFEGPLLVSQTLLQGISRHAIVAKLSMIAMVLGLTFSIIGIQSYGLIGVAIGFALPQIVLLGLMLPMLVNRVLGLNSLVYYAQTMGRTAVPAMVLGFVLIWLEREIPPVSYGTLLFDAVLGGGVYVVASLIFATTRVEKRDLYGFFAAKLRPAAQRE